MQALLQALAAVCDKQFARIWLYDLGAPGVAMHTQPWYTPGQVVNDECVQLAHPQKLLKQVVAYCTDLFCMMKKA